MKTKIPEIDISEYNGKIGNQMTFHCVVKEYYDKGISKGWHADSTHRSYINDYNKVLFPIITDKVSLANLSKEYFDEIIDKISDNYFTSEHKPISEPRRRHFRHLIRRVVETGAQNGICDDYLWGTVFAPDEGDSIEGDEPNKDKLQIIQKSLTPVQELKIYNHIMISPLQTGQKMGLAIMFCSGVRNEEACGLNFEDLIVIPNHKGCYCIRIFKTTYQYSNELKGKGKTTNAYRILPVPKALSDLILARKEYLQSLFEKGEIKTPVEKLPIVCVGNDYENRCIADHLTSAGRQLFKDIEVDEKLVRSAEEELIDIFTAAIDIDDEVVLKKQATTYLLRRNYATHLLILELDDVEIHYLMGHQIENRSFNRNDLNNPDKLFAMYKKLNQRPLVGTPDYGTCIIETVEDISINIKSKTSFEFDVCGEVYLQLTTSEPNDKISIRFNKPEDVLLEGTYTILPVNEEYTKNISVLSEYHAEYIKLESKKELLHSIDGK